MNKNNIYSLKKLSLTQRCAVVALLFLAAIIVCQLFQKQQLAEKFAVLLYYSLCLATFFALTEEWRMRQYSYRLRRLQHVGRFLVANALVPVFLYSRRIFLSCLSYGTRSSALLLDRLPVLGKQIYTAKKSIPLGVLLYTWRIVLACCCGIAAGLWSYSKQIVIDSSVGAEHVFFAIPPMTMTLLTTALFFALLFAGGIYLLLAFPRDDLSSKEMHV